MERGEPEDHKSISSPVRVQSFLVTTVGERVWVVTVGGVPCEFYRKPIFPCGGPRLSNRYLFGGVQTLSSGGGQKWCFFSSCKILISSVEWDGRIFYGEVIALGMVMVDFVCIVTRFNSKY